MSSPEVVMRKAFHKCPICKSAKGYAPSPFYPNVTCKSCNAEFLVRSNSLELKSASKFKWDEKLLNKEYPFDFWNNLKTPQIVEKIFVPLDYVGGSQYHRNPVIGYLRVNSDGLKYKSSEGSVHEMEVNIAPRQLLETAVIKANDVGSVLKGKRLLINTSNHYLLLKYKDKRNRKRQLILDFHGNEQNASELIALANRFKQTMI
jgi:hypothetical protein